MQTNKKPMPVSHLFKLHQLGHVDHRPDYQRPAAWTRPQKRLLIDSILRGYDVPKMYWRRLPEGKDFMYEVIDGQQRLLTVWEFCDNQFTIADNADPVGEYEIGGKRYSELHPDLALVFDSYLFDIVIVEKAIQNDKEDEIREMFLRLQNGTSLKAQEKRNALKGQMRNFVKELADHAFFQSCHFKNTRLAFDHIAAQLTQIELSGGPTNVRDADLNKLYNENVNFSDRGKPARKIRQTLDYMLRAFPAKTGELTRYSVVTLYCLASTLIEKYVYQGTEKMVRDWFLDFENKRRNNQQVSERDRDPELVEYRRLISQSTDAEESIGSRLKTMERRFFLTYPNIELRDPNRSFSNEQRLAIYHRDQGRCQLAQVCDGGAVPWDNWHADHVVPHAGGGKTIVQNGQVACAACNQAKGASMDWGKK